MPPWLAAQGALNPADRLVDMRRWLSILLLVVMPFQFSWAAVGTYCEHETGRLAQHFGHHEHEHQAVAATSGEESTTAKSTPALDVADCHFHCQCVVDMPASMVMPMRFGDSPLTDWTEAGAIAPVLSRPERPQWAGHA